MENRQVNTAGLERQVRRWRAAALCLGALAAVGGPLGIMVAKAQAAEAALRAARSAEIVTIDIPGGAEPSLVADGVELAADTREYTLTGKTDLSWKNGVRVRSDRAIVRMVVDRETKARRVFIEPTAGAGR